jgi:hypothetical protein
MSVHASKSQRAFKSNRHRIESKRLRRDMAEDAAARRIDTLKLLPDSNL